MTALSDFIERDCGKPHWLLTGRATAALYLLLRARDEAPRQVLLPVNVCYSLVHAVTLAGHQPRFLDVDSRDGNIRAAAVEQALGPETTAVVAVHNLGAPCGELPQIRTLCERRDVPLVEDCAAALGGSLAGRPLGSFGDYALFSFGRGKTVDATLGGLLAANTSLQAARRLNAQLPLWSAMLEEKNQLFSRLYGLVYHSSFYEELLPRLAPFTDFFEDTYRFRLTPEQAERVERAFADLPGRVAERQAIREFYDRELPFRPDRGLQKLPLPVDAVPWRYSVLVSEPNLRRALIDALLAANVHVSAWYPPVNELFGDHGRYPGAWRFARQVLNFAPTGGLEETRRITGIVKRIVESPDRERRKEA